MAEAIVNAQMGDRWQAVSAGTQPAGYVHPKAIQVLEEIGIYHIGESKNIDQYRSWDLDLVVTVCDSAAEECPVWLGRGQKAHISFRDPAEAVGSKEEILQVFRDVRDEIQQQITGLLKNLE
jgi:arsenate reductase